MGRTRALQRTERQYRGSNDRYTPAWLLARVHAFLGDYYDPCPASWGHMPAVNGLQERWHGRVFVNPPYRPIAPWIAKVATEPVDELLLLVPAYTDTAWFAPLWDYPMCFIRGRVSFHTPEGREVRAPHPSVFVYRGPRPQQFIAAFSDIGNIMQPLPRRQAPTLWEVSA